VKGLKAKGKRINNQWEVGEVEELEPLRQPEPDPEADPDNDDGEGNADGDDGSDEPNGGDDGGTELSLF
jgi:hypothetical protein